MRKTKTIRNIEEKMENMDPSTIRYQLLENAMNFKSSWMGLGEMLYTVWKEKLYKDWGYQEFDTYTSKEIGIQKQTALKLLRSYSFLEKEEPVYLKKDYSDAQDTASVPMYESVDILRKAKNNSDIDEKDYSRIRKYVLDDGKDPKAVKNNVAEIIKDRQGFEPEEIRQKKRILVVKRFIGTLRSLRNELKASKIVSGTILKEADELIEKLEMELQ